MKATRVIRECNHEHFREISQFFPRGKISKFSQQCPTATLQQISCKVPPLLHFHTENFHTGEGEQNTNKIKTWGAKNISWDLRYSV